MTRLRRLGRGLRAVGFALGLAVIGVFAGPDALPHMAGTCTPGCPWCRRQGR